MKRRGRESISGCLYEIVVSEKANKRIVSLKMLLE